MGELSPQAAKPQNTQTLIDYYKMLSIPTDASESLIRQQINELYVKAQQNLDHRNHRKRFYYHELYEVHIPQARVFLLDPQKRAAYDKFLAGHKRPEWQAEPRQPAKDRQPVRAVMHLPATQQPVAHAAQVAAFVGATSPAVAVATAGASGAGNVATFSATGVLSPTAPPARVAKPRVQARRAEPQAARIDPTEDRRRDDQRRELIKHELIFVGMRWGILTGLAAVSLCSLLLLILSFLLPRGGASLGLTDSFPLGLALGMVLVSTLCARAAMRWARRRVVGLLSQMPYEELLRHCAH